MNVAIYPHNALSWMRSKHKTIEMESHPCSTGFHVSELVLACPARAHSHQTGATLISSKTTIKKHHVSLLRATFRCNDTGLRWMTGWTVEQKQRETVKLCQPVVYSVVSLFTLIRICVKHGKRNVSAHLHNTVSICYLKNNPLQWDTLLATIPAFPVQQQYYTVY